MPTGREIDFTWRADGQPATIIQHGITYTLTYDDSSGGTRNLKQITDSLGRTATFGYDQNGNVATASDGATTSSFTYDPNNRLVTAVDALGNQTTLGYTQVNCGCSDRDEVTSIQTPDLATGLQWSLTYGAEGRLSSVIDPDGHAELYGYEPTGELNSLQDRDGNLTTISHDHLGRMLTLVDALGRAHTHAYTMPSSSSWVGPTLMSGSASATLASTDITAALGSGDYQIGHNIYQVDNWPPELSFYRDATFELAYAQFWDYAKRMTSNRDRAGLPISSSELSNFFSEQSGYDGNTAAPVLTNQSAPTATGSINATFDRNAEFDLTDSNFGSTSFTYDRDPGGRLTATHRKFSFNNNIFNGPDQTYAYYANGKLKQYGGPDGTKTFVYDARGLVQTMTLVLGGQTETWQFDYDAVGRSFHVTFPDGHVRVQLYDNEGRIKSRCYQYGSQSFCYTATYDGAGNPTVMTDPYGGEDDYQYDALNRLSQVTRKVGGATEHVETYNYNAIGALHTNFDVSSMSTVTLDDQRPKVAGGGTADAAIPNTLRGQTVTLDAGGRVTSLLGTTFTNDWHNRLAQAQYTASNGDSIHDTNDLDGFLRRVHRMHSDTTTGTPSMTTTTEDFYVHDGDNLVARTNSSNALQDAFLFERVDHPLRLSRSGTSYFYEVDLAGNVRRLRDSSGADLGGYRYTPFGQTFAADGQTPAATIDQPLRWKGRWFDPAAGGVYDVRARWWCPLMGAFLSIDEFAYHDPKSTLWAWPEQNPLKFSDPTGRFGFVGAAAGFVAGAVGGYITGGTWQSAALGGAVGAATGLIAPWAAEAAGAAAAAAGLSATVGEAAAAGVLGGASSAAGQLAGNFAAGDPLTANFSFGAIAGAAGGEVLFVSAASAGEGPAVITALNGGQSVESAVGEIFKAAGEGLASGTAEGAGQQAENACKNQ